VKVVGWGDAAKAEAMIFEGIARYNEAKAKK
jgi:inorganic pyrophosphatase